MTLCFFDVICWWIPSPLGARTELGPFRPSGPLPASTSMLLLSIASIAAFISAANLSVVDCGRTCRCGFRGFPAPAPPTPFVLHLAPFRCEQSHPGHGSMDKVLTRLPRSLQNIQNIHCPHPLTLGISRLCGLHFSLSLSFDNFEPTRFGLGGSSSSLTVLDAVVGWFLCLLPRPDHWDWTRLRAALPLLDFISRLPSLPPQDQSGKPTPRTLLDASPRLCTSSYSQ
jgi:hypothetical protein